MRSSETLIDRDRQDLASRQALDESRLIRFVAGPDGAVVPDLARKLPGRGLWVAADRVSLEAAIKKNMFARAAKAPGWLIAYGHDVESAPTPYGCTPEDLDRLIRLAKAAGLEILPVGEAWERISGGL
ncbi:MAG TPA: hypothetical protein DCP26_04360 [Brevundimonas sp.]|nr:hypothetical protein [Brevundimonas sp.]